MIYAYQLGRCGNQLFVYTFIRKLQIEFQYEDEIVFIYKSSNFGKKTIKSGDFWEDSLIHFNTVPYSITEDTSVNNKLSKKQVVLFTVISKMNHAIFRFIHPRSKISCFFEKIITPFLSKNGIYINNTGFPMPYKKSGYENKIVMGLFECDRFIEPIFQKIKNEFSSKEMINKEAQMLLKSMNTIPNTVCVSLRNWEIDVKNMKMLNRRNICDKEYYEKAIEIMENRLEKPTYIVFSDDIPWAYGIISNIVSDKGRILCENKNNNVAEKLTLMSSCKHFILANSTFSWWAEYISNDASKIVISPRKWLKIPNESSLIRKSWILIE